MHRGKTVWRHSKEGGLRRNPPCRHFDLNFQPPRLWENKFLFVILFGYAERRILAPRSGIEPVPPVLGVQSLKHWTAREVLINFCYLNHPIFGALLWQHEQTNACELLLVFFYLECRIQFTSFEYWKHLALGMGVLVHSVEFDPPSNTGGQGFLSPMLRVKDLAQEVKGLRGGGL